MLHLNSKRITLDKNYYILERFLFLPQSILKQFKQDRLNILFLGNQAFSLSCGDRPDC